jgi:Tfp pilus assembly protein PilO
VSKLNERQLLVATILVPTLAIAGIGWLTWTDYQKIYAAEVSDEHPANAEITDPELWGEHRKSYEIQKEMDQLRGEAELIAKREQDVIVYREIVQRDSQILPDKDLVTQFVTTIDEFARQSGVAVTDVSDLNVMNTQGQAISRVPIRMALSGSYDQFLKFLNLFETMPRIVNTRSFGIQAGARAGDDPNAPASHAITLELETYVYTAQAGLSKPVEIANYERRKDDPVIQKLVRQQKAAKVESYHLRPRISRRDPMVDPRRSNVGPGDGGLAPEKYEELKRLSDRLKNDVTLLQEDLRLMSQYLQEKKYIQYVQIRTQITDKVSSLEVQIKDASAKMVVPELREIFSEEVEVAFASVAGVVAKTEGTEIRPIMRQHVAEFVEKQKTALEACEYERALQVSKDFDALIARPNHKLADDAQPLVAELHENARKASIMIEFDNLNLKVTGIIRQPQGSLVIVNGKTRRVGDYVDAHGRCKLVSIKDDVLVFDLDGYEIERSLEKKS